MNWAKDVCKGCLKAIGSDQAKFDTKASRTRYSEHPMGSAQNPLDTCALPWKALKCPTQSFSKIYFENYGKISYFLKKLKIKNFKNDNNN